MAKHLIDIDEELLEHVRLICGTRTMKDTVNAALAATVQAKTEAVRRAIEYFAARSAEGVFDDIEDAW